MLNFMVYIDIIKGKYFNKMPETIKKDPLKYLRGPLIK